MTFRQNMNMEIIVAVDEAGGFGKEGKIPWNFKEDFKHFQATTKGHVCIMGRKTYEDMLEMRTERENKKDEPQSIDEILPERESFVVTSQTDYNAQGATPVSNIREAVQSLDEEDTRTVFVLGGRRIFIEALNWVTKIHLTLIEGTYDCDVFFPIEVLNRDFKITSAEQKEQLKFITYERKR